MLFGVVPGFWGGPPLETGLPACGRVVVVVVVSVVWLSIPMDSRIYTHVSLDSVRQPCEKHSIIPSMDERDLVAFWLFLDNDLLPRRSVV